MWLLEEMVWMWDETTGMRGEGSRRGWLGEVGASNFLKNGNKLFYRCKITFFIRATEFSLHL